ncbi:3'-5' exonuclease [Pseudoalteromonas mariniglutinosa]|uniref:3'-5' exonuclease n=1 Tax=Pseudoalteromonas mariniglutinosa TaxID=206042 RepID=UPI00384B973F
MNNSSSHQDWAMRYSQLAIRSNDDRIKQFYQAAISDGDQPINQTPLVALDFETTGLNYESDEIVSVGLVPFTTERIYCRESKHWVVQPARQSLDEQSIIIHGITHSQVDGAPDFSAVIEPLLSALKGRIIVVHFAAIERHFLFNALYQRLQEGLEFAVIDTMVLEKRALQAKQGLLGRLFKSRLGSLRLFDSRLRYSLPSYQNHNALTDALATAELLQAQLSYHYRSDTPLSELWL